MIVTVQLEQEDFDSIHDILFELTERSVDNDTCQYVWDNLPKEIQSTAIQWGTSDTVFRDQAYSYLKNEMENAQKNG